MDNRDLRSLFTGAAVALAAGLTMGAAMQPNLRADDHPAGPQILAGISAPRADRLYDLQATWAAYHGKIPDYVIGTDWTKPREYAANAYEVLAYDERSEPSRETVVYQDESVTPQSARWEEPRHEPVAYPSMAGNTPTVSDLPAPPEPPSGSDFDGDPATG